MFTARGCSFTAYAINLVDELTAELPIKVYLHDHHGQQITGRLGEEEAAGRIILESWLNRQVLYRPDLARENRYGEHLQSQPGYEPVRSANDVPFYSGNLALASARPDAFSAADIVFFLDLAQVLEDGFRRLEDLRALQQALQREEAMGRRIEQAWTEELRGLGIPVNRVSLQLRAADQGWSGAETGPVKNQCQHLSGIYSKDVAQVQPHLHRPGADPQHGGRGHRAPPQAAGASRPPAGSIGAALTEIPKGAKRAGKPDQDCGQRGGDQGARPGLLGGGHPDGRIPALVARGREVPPLSYPQGPAGGALGFSQGRPAVSAPPAPGLPGCIPPPAPPARAGAGRPAFPRSGPAHPARP